MRKVFINIPEYGLDSEDTEKTINIIKGICIAIYSYKDETIEFLTPLYDQRDDMYGFISALKLMNDCSTYVKIDPGDTCDELYLALESASRIYKDEFEILDLSSITKKIAPQLYD